jgi:hypothetical protein
MPCSALSLAKRRAEPLLERFDPCVSRTGLRRRREFSSLS